MYCTSHLKYILALATALIVTAPVLVAAKGHYEPDSGSSPHVLQNAAKVRNKLQDHYLRDLILTWW